MNSFDDFVLYFFLQLNFFFWLCENMYKSKFLILNVLIGFQKKLGLEIVYKRHLVRCHLWNKMVMNEKWLLTLEKKKYIINIIVRKQVWGKKN